MDQAIKQRWVAALRDPNQKQCRHVLRCGESHCALGLLGWVMEPHGILPLLFLPDNLLEQAGLSTANVNDIERMNDKSRRSFTEIADYVEQNL